jgi:hypothetical protein
MDYALLPRFEDLDGAAALERFLADREDSNGDAGQQLNAVAQIAMYLSVDISKHGIRKLALSLQDGAMDVDGWRFSALPLADKSSLAFKAEKDGSGYAIQAKIEPEMTAEATERYNSFNGQAGEQYRGGLEALKASGVTGTEFEKAKYELLFNRRIPEQDAIKNDPASYKPLSECSGVREISAVAYGSQRRPPEGYTRGNCKPLKQVLEAGSNGGHQSGKLFQMTPDWRFDFGRSEHPVLDTISRVFDVEGTFFALNLVGRGIVAAGLESAVSDFMDQRRQTRYGYIDMGGGDADVHELAAAAIAVTGMVTDQTVEAISDFWMTVSGIDANDSLRDIEFLKKTLPEKGFVQSKGCYECNDLDDFTWVESIDESTTIIWYRGQNGSFRVDCNEDAGEITSLRFARVSDKVWRKGDAAPESAGEFISSFEITDGAAMPAEHAPMTTRNIFDMNTIIFGMQTVACCFEGDYEIDRDEEISSEARP